MAWRSDAVRWILATDSFRPGTGLPRSPYQPDPPLALARTLVAHRLDPPSGQPHLPPAEVVRRLEGEFDFVDADADAGAKHMSGMIRQLERMGRPDSQIEEFRQRQVLAVRVTVADSPEFTDEYVSFVAMPGEGLFVGYHSAEHERRAAPLLERCGWALGYEITLV